MKLDFLRELPINFEWTVFKNHRYSLTVFYKDYRFSCDITAPSSVFTPERILQDELTIAIKRLQSYELGGYRPNLYEEGTRWSVYYTDIHQDKLYHEIGTVTKDPNYGGEHEKLLSMNGKEFWEYGILFIEKL